MIAALLLPLLLAGGPAPVQPAVASHDDPPIQLWISNDRRFLPGDRAQGFEVRSKDDGYLIVFHVDPDGYLRVLFPLDPDKDNFVRGGKKYEVRGRGSPGRRSRPTAKAGAPCTAAVAREPFRFEGFLLSVTMIGTTGPSLYFPPLHQSGGGAGRTGPAGGTETPTHDILSYEVVGTRGLRLRLTVPLLLRLGVQRPVVLTVISLPSLVLLTVQLLHRPVFRTALSRRYYYDPYFYAYDPFYNPFFYDPYYYAPVYRQPFYYRPYYNSPYRNRLDHAWYRGRNNAYTPYRFRGTDGNPLFGTKRGSPGGEHGLSPTGFPGSGTRHLQSGPPDRRRPETRASNPAAPR